MSSFKQILIGLFLFMLTNILMIFGLDFFSILLFIPSTYFIIKAITNTEN